MSLYWIGNFHPTSLRSEVCHEWLADKIIGEPKVTLGSMTSAESLKRQGYLGVYEQTRNETIDQNTEDDWYLL